MVPWPHNNVGQQESVVGREAVLQPLQDLQLGRPHLLRFLTHTESPSTVRERSRLPPAGYAKHEDGSQPLPHLHLPVSVITVAPSSIHRRSSTSEVIHPQGAPTAPRACRVMETKLKLYPFSSQPVHSQPLQKADFQRGGCTTPQMMEKPSWGALNVK